jgi:hypothetical protein
VFLSGEDTPFCYAPSNRQTNLAAVLPA